MKHDYFVSSLSLIKLLGEKQFMHKYVFMRKETYIHYKTISLKVEAFGGAEKKNSSTKTWFN